jgi:hypothetical protein
MKPIRHLLFIVIALILIAIFFSVAHAFWMSVGLILAIGANNFTHVIGAASDKYGSSDWTLRFVLLFTVLTFVFAVLSAIVIFFWYGWLPAVIFVALFVGYFGLREDRLDKYKREVRQVRAALVEYITKELSGQITQRQLEERFDSTLQQSLPEQAYNLDFIYEHLLDQTGLRDSQYKVYLTQLERCLSTIERRHVLRSKLHSEVRARLGLSSGSK